MFPVMLRIQTNGLKETLSSVFYNLARKSFSAEFHLKLCPLPDTEDGLLRKVSMKFEKDDN